MKRHPFLLSEIPKTFLVKTDYENLILQKTNKICIQMSVPLTKLLETGKKNE